MNVLWCHLDTDFVIKFYVVMELATGREDDAIAARLKLCDRHLMRLVVVSLADIALHVRGHERIALEEQTPDNRPLRHVLAHKRLDDALNQRLLIRRGRRVT